MKITGKHILSIDQNTLWEMLQDKDVLARISPGVSSIELIEEDHFKAISEISIGPVRGSFEGTILLKDKKEPSAMTMVLQQKSQMGHAEAEITMNLSDLDGVKTSVDYTGKAKVSGKLATMGQRILGGVVSTLSKQVFKELEKIIEERAPKEESVNGKSEEALIEPKKNYSFLQYLIQKIKSLWK